MKVLGTAHVTKDITVDPFVGWLLISMQEVVWVSTTMNYLQKEEHITELCIFL